MNDKWIDYAIRIQSIAQTGLQYCKDEFDKERYEELRKISAEMVSAKTDISLEKIYDLFCNESGYQTPICLLNLNNIITPLFNFHIERKQRDFFIYFVLKAKYIYKAVRL